ncbi:MAG: MAPEG family protein, partial [Xanthomonadaceae bacterium]|nr:MAPEG family protein [Xanthomonadaceae bacterium]
ALGAQLYLWARVAYLPVYAAGIPYLRSAVWGVSMVGLLLVLSALF